MTATITEFDIDYDLAVPCEASFHSSGLPGEWIMRAECPYCDNKSMMTLCNPCKIHMESQKTLACGKCPAVGMTHEQVKLRFVRI